MDEASAPDSEEDEDSRSDKALFEAEESLVRDGALITAADPLQLMDANNCLIRRKITEGFKNVLLAVQVQKYT